MTQTPASGPLGPVTTPPMSTLSIATSLAGCCADEDPNGRNDDKATTVMRPVRNERGRFLIMMRSVRCDLRRTSVATVATSGRGTREICRFVDAPGARVACDLRIRTERTRACHFPRSDLRRLDPLRQRSSVDPGVERAHHVERVRPFSTAAVPHPRHHVKT